MTKFFSNSKKSSFIGILLSLLVVAFLGVLAIAWEASVQLKETVAANAAVMNVDSSALIELERLRNLAESQMTNSRAYFLLGSKSLMDKQKSDKQGLADGMAAFEKQHGLPQIQEIAKNIAAIEQQEQDIFDQAIGYRNKATESKIVAQFYQSKTNPLLSKLNEQFDQVAKLQNAEIDQARNRARQAGLDAQTQIPKNMLWFMTAVSAIFFCVTLLVVWMLFVRRSHFRVRDRLLTEAQNAILARDEVISAVAEDMKEPLMALGEIALELKPEQSEQVKGVVTEINTIVADILDQKKADMGALTLRLEQLAVADILDDAQVMLQPLAKKRDITLQFDSVNQTVLAYVDRERVMRVLANLVGNAIKFSPKHSKVQIKVKADAQFANISVLDNGPGIPANRLASIFENFWQARRTADQGPGVGLAVVKTIIEAHGGIVKADNSMIGGGSTFTFSLPRRRPAGAQIKKPSASGVRKMARYSPLHENSDGPTA